MKKAFEQNVSRAKPRTRLTAFLEAPAQAESEPVIEDRAAPPVAAPAAKALPTLGEELKARIAKGAQKLSAQESIRHALSGVTRAGGGDAEAADRLVTEAMTRAEPELSRRVLAKSEAVSDAPPVEVAEAPELPLLSRRQPEHVEAPVEVTEVQASVGKLQIESFADVMSEIEEGERAMRVQTQTNVVAEAVVAKGDAPAEHVEVQRPDPVREGPLFDPRARREKLKERLRAVRENPRPEPLPPTVLQTGVLAVERITSLQIEVEKLKALNLALTQDLEAARRQSEKATEEARSRMEEANRLSSEMEGRARLLSELERELATLEGERDESLLKLQESRQALEAAAAEKTALKSEISARDQSLAESLAEEEKIAGELESAQVEITSLRRAVDALSGERDTLARQVSELTTERAELYEARKALEAVHRALAKAVVR